VDDTCGVVLKENDWKAVYDKLTEMQSGALRFDPEACAAKASRFDEKRMERDYLRLYDSIVAHESRPIPKDNAESRPKDATP
jgi:hypothetical protein